MTELDLAVERLESKEEEYELRIEKYGYDAVASELEEELIDLEYEIEHLEECEI